MKLLSKQAILSIMKILIGAMAILAGILQWMNVDHGLVVELHHLIIVFGVITLLDTANNMFRSLLGSTDLITTEEETVV